MASPAIDYDALAKQYGAVSSTPAATAPAAIDYDALAKQHGAISSTGGTPQVESSIRYLTTSDYQQPPPEPGTVTRFGKRYTQQTGINDLLDIIRASNRYGTPQEVAARGEKAKTALGHVVTGLRDEPARIGSELAGIWQSMLDPRQDTADMSMHMLGVVPMVGPAIQGFVHDVWAKKYPEAAADLAAIATLTKGPKLIGAAGEALPAVTRTVESVPAVVGGAVKGGWQGATGPTVLPIKVKGVQLAEIPNVPASLSGAITGAGAGGLFGGRRGALAGAVTGATIPVARGALAGMRSALAEAQAARAAAAGEIPPNVTVLSPDYFDRLRLGPGPTIPPAPASPDASFVRGVSAQYAQPEPVPPSRQLGPGPIVTPPPADASFVRSVPAEYPPVESPIVRGAQQAGEFTPEETARAAAILENVEPQAAPAAPAASKPAAAELAQQFEATTRPDRMLDFLKRMDPEISAAAIDNLDPNQWELVARGAGSPAGTIPTPEDIAAVRGSLAQSEGASQITAKTPEAAKAQFEQNREIRTKRKGPAVATEPAPAAAPTAGAPPVPESWQGAQPPPPGPPAPTASEVRVESFAKHLAQGEIPTDTLAGLPSQPKALLQLEELGRSLGIEGRPAPGEVQQIVDRVRQLRGEGTAAATKPPAAAAAPATAQTLHKLPLDEKGKVVLDLDSPVAVAMRKVDADAQRLIDYAAKLAPRGGTVAVGKEGVSQGLTGWAMRSLLREISRGTSLDEAVQIATKELIDANKLENTRSPHYMTAISERSGVDKIEYAAKQLTKAFTDQPSPAEAPQTLRTLMEGEKAAATASPVPPMSEGIWQMTRRQHAEANAQRIVDAGFDPKAIKREVESSNVRGGSKRSVEAEIESAKKAYDNAQAVLKGEGDSHFEDYYHRGMVEVRGEGAAAAEAGLESEFDRWHREMMGGQPETKVESFEPASVLIPRKPKAASIQPEATREPVAASKPIAEPQTPAPKVIKAETFQENMQRMARRDSESANATFQSKLSFPVHLREAQFTKLRGEFWSRIGEGVPFEDAFAKLDQDWRSFAEKANARGSESYAEPMKAVLERSHLKTMIDRATANETPQTLRTLMEGEKAPRKRRSK